MARAPHVGHVAMRFRGRRTGVTVVKAEAEAEAGQMRREAMRALVMAEGGSDLPG